MLICSLWGWGLGGDHCFRYWTVRATVNLQQNISLNPPGTENSSVIRRVPYCCWWLGSLHHQVISGPSYIMRKDFWHYIDVTMTTMASQITSLTVVYSIVDSDADQRKHQSSASLAFVCGIHRGPVDSPHKGSVTQKMFPFDEVIMWNGNVVILMIFFNNGCTRNCHADNFRYSQSSKWRHFRFRVPECPYTLVICSINISSARFAMKRIDSFNFLEFPLHNQSIYLTLLMLTPENPEKTRPKPYDDVMKWKHFPRYWPFVRGIHRFPVNSPHKGQWRGALMFSLICLWINDWVNDREAGDLRRNRAHHDVIVMAMDDGGLVT